MKANDLWGFYFSEDPKEECDIKCPECNYFSHHDIWQETEVFCEDCGGHYGISCPVCGEAFDNVYEKRIFEIKNI